MTPPADAPDEPTVPAARPDAADAAASAAVTYSFEFDDRMARWSRLFRVTPTNSSVTLAPHGLDVRFGRWRLSTPWSNIASASVAGPYARWKVMGPARLSLADRGITFATTARHGVCVTFHQPVPAIEPLGLLRHPNATLTVADPESFVEALTARAAASRVSSAGREAGPAPAPGPPQPRGTVARSLTAVVRWLRRGRSVVVRTRHVDEVAVPAAADDTRLADGQPISGGTGAWFHRRYSTTVRQPTTDAHGVMDAIRRDINVLVDPALAPFTKLRGAHGDLQVGDRYVVETAGPWSGPVEVVSRTDRSFRLATLDGHMEAGLIEFTVDGTGDELHFTIESWNRSAGRAIDALYDRLTVAQHLQSEMWVEACERFAALSGGECSGPVRVDTERAPERPPG